MSFKFWHATDTKVTPIQNGIGFINLDFRARVTGAGHNIPHFFFEHGRQKLNTIISRATNRAGENFKTVIMRETARTYYTRQKDIKDSLTLRKAYGQNSFNFTLISKGKRHSLRDYKISPTHPRKGGHTLIYGAVKREGGLKPLKHRGEDKPIGFLVKGAGGKYYPFYRIGQGKNKIKGYMSPSIPQLMKNKISVFRATLEAQKTFEKRLEHELFQQWGLIP
ncbi:MAG: hypothetical protein IJQ57_06660 [Synergistaceae bacterium]|nr:hypothetical protein [Synergistaceae bacterium]